MSTTTRRALIIATVPMFFVHMRTVVSVLKDLKYEVDAATNLSVLPSFDFDGYKNCHNVHFSRSPVSRENVRALRDLQKLIDEGKYDLVFCNTPVGGVLGRLASRKSRKGGMRVVYMAHGFHFFNGASLANWLLFYPVEWLCSWLTDDLITITKEDHQRAVKHFHARRIHYVPGVGVDLSRFEGVGGTGIRSELGIGKGCKLLLSVGELNRNKNHQVVVRALVSLDQETHYAIAGSGPEYGFLVSLAKELGVDNRVHLLGQRRDVPALMAAADVFVLPSIREGLNVSLMEAMSSGLPCACRDIRGNVDLIENGFNGLYVHDWRDSESWAVACQSLMRVDRILVADFNQKKCAQFSLTTVSGHLKTILAQTS